MLIVLLLGSVQCLAQDSLVVKVGFMFNPQSSISLTEGGSPKLLTPLLLGTVLVHKGNIFIPHYNLVANAIGVTYVRDITPKLQTYCLFNKFVTSKGGYASIGFATPLGFASGFVEVGSIWHKWSPDVNIGIIIPLTLKIK